MTFELEVKFLVDAYLTVEVEAESEEEAQGKLREQLDNKWRGNPTLANGVPIADWESLRRPMLVTFDY